MKKIVHDPFSYSDFLERLSTFSSALHWFGMPKSLSPLQCARFGWINVDRNMLQCCHCREYLFAGGGGGGGLSAAVVGGETSGEEEEGLVKRVQKDGHAALCVWNECPSPEEFCTTVRVDGWEERLASLSEFVQQGVALDPAFVRHIREQEGGAAILVSGLVALACCGWEAQKRAGEECCLSCRLCNSVILLSADVSSQQGSQQGSQRTIKSELYQKDCPPGFIHPINEHRYFCPWSEGDAWRIFLPYLQKST